MAYFTPSCRGASLLTGNLQLIIPFQKRVPVGMSTESLPISSFHSSSFTAPFFLVLGLYELDFSLNSRSQTAFISPLSAFSPRLDKVYTRFHGSSSGTGYARIEVYPCPSTSIMRNARQVIRCRCFHLIQPFLVCTAIGISHCPAPHRFSFLAE